ncbi:MAG: signal peptide peptidase SppA, partial [Desulfobacterales bacterium]|nr:signal peptide peptidase SppA [Desulfobacterales bacterium]
MYSRRHPYLFFLLVSAAIAAVATLGLSSLFVLGGDRAEFEFGEKVGVVDISGVIIDARGTIDQIKQLREEDDIKAIVVRIDSPGGAVAPSQEIYREIRKTVPIKKVVASMGAVAASGGYYIAAAADGIIASPGTITGSIGVIMAYTNYRALLDKIGLVPVVVKSGTYKDTGSPVREMTASEKELLEGLTDKIHRQFIKDIVEGRRMDPEKVVMLADGRIYTGEEAIDLGLVDRLGNIEDAIEWAGRMGGIEGKVSAVYVKEDKFSLLDYLLGTSLKAYLVRLLKGELSAEA